MCCVAFSLDDNLNCQPIFSPNAPCRCCMGLARRSFILTNKHLPNLSLNTRLGLLLLAWPSRRHVAHLGHWSQKCAVPYIESTISNHELCRQFWQTAAFHMGVRLFCWTLVDWLRSPPMSQQSEVAVWPTSPTHRSIGQCPWSIASV